MVSDLNGPTMTINTKDALFTSDTPTVAQPTDTSTGFLKLLVTLLFACLFLFSDFYYTDIGRPFDYLALILLLLIVMLYKSNPPPKLRVNAVLLFSLLLPWCIAGFWNESALAAIAIMVGAGYVVPLSVSVVAAVRGEILDRAIFLTLIVSLAIFYLQSGVYVATGIFIDIPQLAGSIESRGLNEALGYFRPSGIFQEPNAYCTVMFSLGTVYALMGRRWRYLEILLILSFLLSRSLWGFGAGAVLFGMLYGARYTFVAVIVGGFAVALLYLTVGMDIEGLTASSTTASRIFGIFDDASAQARFGQMSNFEFGTALLAGSGVDTTNFQDFGANGIAFMLYCFGLGGAAAILLFYKIFLKIKLRTAVSVGILLTTYPPFSYMYFWFWLATMVLLEFCSNNQPPAAFHGSQNSSFKPNSQRYS